MSYNPNRRIMANRKRCSVCKAFFYDSRTRVKTCSPACSKDQNRRCAAVRAKAAREMERSLRPVADASREPVHCDAARVFVHLATIHEWQRS